MTAALVRVCNSCKKPFLKDYGCNHMVCDCGNEQCFVCSENINGYGHFGDLPGMCPQSEDTEQRLRMEVASAQNNMVREILEGQTEWTEAEVMVDVTLPSAIHLQQLERARQDEIERQEINRIWARRTAEQAERARVQREYQERVRAQKARAKRDKARRQAQKEESERQERIREARRAKRKRRRQRKKEEKELEEQRNQRQRRGRNRNR